MQGGESHETKEMLANFPGLISTTKDEAGKSSKCWCRYVIVFRVLDLLQTVMHGTKKGNS